ncbi:hypothetical protein [Methylobacterium durans]|uniref:Uncharacterized protein n=1 Tax=Methylobacterium durans TaxID=2202825 RepID=A0A2U8VZS5_9HYPH|nr:hypothetical protein [Methylobacterium durans]AWN39309.1 hypothetical protein DK389_00480 [Methylobacterium durans]
MYFQVSAIDRSRSVTFQRASMTDALEKALGLLGSGLTEVTITHPDGARHTPTEFLAAYRSAQERRPAQAGLRARAA